MVNFFVYDSHKKLLNIIVSKYLRMLIGNNISKSFGGLHALKNVDFEVKKGEIRGLIGPNGAGKTTLFNVISGIYHSDSGTLKFDGVDISRLPPHKICKLGIGRTFQIVQPFNELTVFKNVMIGIMFGRDKSVSRTEANEKAMKILDFLELRGKRDHLAGSLIFAEKKRLELARALATDPKVLLLDEIASGLNPTETLQAMELIKRLRSERGITVFWVEHVMKAVMGVADCVVVIHHGEKIAEGKPSDISKNKNVIEAYLGEKKIL